MSSSLSGFTLGAPVACGKWMRTRPSSMNWLVRVKKTTIISTTSMSEIMLISGSSRRRGLKFTVRDASGAGGAAHRGLRRLERIGEADGVLLHRDDDAIHLALQEPVGKERRNGDDETRGGADERFGDAARQRPRIAHAARLNGVERLDDAGDGAEEPEERRHRRDGPERVEEAFELVNDVTARVREPFHHRFARAMPVVEPRSEHTAERRVLFEGGDDLVVDLVRLDELPDLAGELTGQDPAVLQRPQTLERDGGGRDGTQDDWPHERAAGPHDFPHCRFDPLAW